jgi:hypothetical protein
MGIFSYRVLLLVSLFFHLHPLEIGSLASKRENPFQSFFMLGRSTTANSFDESDIAVRNCLNLPADARLDIGL